MSKFVYQATKAASAAYESAYGQAIKARKDALAEFLEQHGFHPDTSVYAHEEGTGRVVGVQSDTVPAGWRADRQHPGAIVPALRTRHGKSIEKAMAAIPHSDGRALLPGGMPHHCTTGHVLMHPSVEVLGGVLFVGWPRELPEKIENRLDFAVWREVPLSAYHLAREQHGAHTPA